LPVRLYFDHNVNQEVIHGLRLRGLDVLTAFEDGAQHLPGVPASPLKAGANSA
jgi:hypothetical protein